MMAGGPSPDLWDGGLVPAVAMGIAMVGGIIRFVARCVRNRGFQGDGWDK